MPQFVAIALVAVATLGSYAGGVWKALRWVLFAVVIYFFVLPLVPAFRGAIGDLRQIDPILLAAAIGLEFVALYCYTLVTHAALGPDAYRLRRFDLFRTQVHFAWFTLRFATLKIVVTNDQTLRRRAV